MAYRFAKLSLVSLVLPAVIARPVADVVVYDTEIDMTYQTDVVTVVAGAAPAATPAAAPVVVTVPAPAATSAPAVVAPAVKAAAAPVAAPVAAAAAKAAPAVATGAATASSTLSGSKAGLAYNDISLLPAFGSKASWAYDWVSGAGGKLPSGIQFVPMLHSTSPEWTDVWASQSQGAEYCLAFNEPDQNGISPSEAASSYKNVYQKEAPAGALLGSPATTSTQTDANMGLGWMTQFLAACSDCKIDFIAAHWYGAPDQLSNFQSYLTDVHTTTGKPVWVTEYALSPWMNYPEEEQSAFMAQATEWLEQQKWVQRYSPYMVGSGQGMFTAGTSVGAAFLKAVL